MGGRSNTLWGRLGFENWLFKASLKIGWTSCLGILAIFQQVIMTLLGAFYVTPFLECGSSVALELKTNERSQNCCFFAHQVRKNLGDGGTPEEDFDFHDTSSFFSSRLLSLGAIGVSQDQDKLDFVQLL